MTHLCFGKFCLNLDATILSEDWTFVLCDRAGMGLESDFVEPARPGPALHGLRKAQFHPQFNGDPSA